MSGEKDNAAERSRRDERFGRGGLLHLPYRDRATAPCELAGTGARIGHA